MSIFGTGFAIYFILGFSFSSVYCILMKDLLDYQHLFKPYKNEFGSFEFFFYVISWPAILIELVIFLIFKSIFGLFSLKIFNLSFLIDNYIDWLKGMRAK